MRRRQRDFQNRVLLEQLEWNFKWYQDRRCRFEFAYSELGSGTAFAWFKEDLFTVCGEEVFEMKFQDTHVGLNKQN